ncbi:MAG: hypothetical protein P8X57_10215 [Cyclobacteriaceae bacterium]
MSKTRLVLVLPMLIGYYAVAAQTAAYNPYFFDQSDEKAVVSPFLIQKLGTMHVDDTWNAGKIRLQNGDSLIGYYIRYDMISNGLEIIIDRKFHSIGNAQLDAFEWFSGESLSIRTFVRRDKYNLPADEYAVGFVELLVDGKLSLIKTTAIVPRLASTSPSLIPENAKGSDMLIIEKYFYVKDGVPFEVSSRRNPNLEFINHKEVDKYVRKNRNNFNTEEDMESVARHYNLVAGKE